MYMDLSISSTAPCYSILLFSSLLSSLSTHLLSSFQASIQKLTWREINFEALQPPGTNENEREGERQQEMQAGEEGVW